MATVRGGRSVRKAFSVYASRVPTAHNSAQHVSNVVVEEAMVAPVTR